MFVSNQSRKTRQFPSEHVTYIITRNNTDQRTVVGESSLDIQIILERDHYVHYMHQMCLQVVSSQSMLYNEAELLLRLI